MEIIDSQEMIFKGYTKRDTTIIKGFAILCIVLHNYFHWIWPAPGQNEFDFDPYRVFKLFELLAAQPGDFVRLLLSFFGHFGVQLFVLLSGFGLAVKWNEQTKGNLQALSTYHFPFSALRKLYPLLLTGVVVCLFGCILMEGRLFNAQEWREIGFKMLFIHTLIPNSGLSINGPWWFFGLIFQLYLLFPLLFRCIRKWGWKAFLVVLLVSYGMIFLFRDALNLHHGEILLQNAPAHLPEFALGILLAFSKDKKIHWIWLLLAVVLFTWGNFAPGFFPFTFLSLCVITVFVTQKWKAARGKWKLKKGQTRKGIHAILNGLHYIGGLSMLLFVVHGYFRMPVLKAAETMKGPLGHLASGLLFFLLVWGIAMAAKPFYLWLQRLFGKWKTEEVKKASFRSVLSKVVTLLLVLFYLYVLVYYIRQNLAARHPDRPLVSTIHAENGQVQRDDRNVMLASFPLESRPLMVHVEGSFDFKQEGGGTVLPNLVMEIPQVRWISKTLQPKDADWTHYTFSYDYARSFIDRIQEKDLKLYFWNSNQAEMQFRNVTITADY